MAASSGSEALAEADWNQLEALEEEIAQAELRLAALRRRRDEHLQARRPNPTISLYDWQLEALAAWEDAGRRGVVQAVTGTGKTRVGLAAIDNARRAGRQTVVIVPTLALVRQ
ncbi:MAG: DEAD/DEAH box helicase family protein [Brooklawnia sp.]|uniref:DEAD/DEAH box helicase family protein n=1 Tax=Brooklawnia sp. TaxID=2699740 RepID=UPI003C795A87